MSKIDYRTFSEIWHGSVTDSAVLSAICLHTKHVAEKIYYLHIENKAKNSADDTIFVNMDYKGLHSIAININMSYRCTGIDI